MREHEVPTHVQAEDRVLLWFTFPQIVAITAVSALSYGAYSYAPGPSEMRMALAVVIGLAGIAMVVGKIGGRQLPLVAADLLRYRLGARFYAGSPAQLVRSEPPAPVESGPGPLSLMARRAGRGPRRLRVMARRGLRRLRRNRRRRDGKTPFRPHGWFGKRREPRAKNNNVNGRQAAGRDGKEKRRNGRRREGGRFLSALLGASALALLVVAVPATAMPTGTTRKGAGRRRRSSSSPRSRFPDGGSSSRGSTCRETAPQSPSGPPPASTSASGPSADRAASLSDSGGRQGWTRESSSTTRSP